MDDQNRRIFGIHHITAIASEPQRNIDFYTGVLGLRLVKVTVNFDDPSAYHLYYGDIIGNPGTVLTFFAWPRAQKGQKGHGQASFVTFSIPDGSLDYWTRRLNEYGVGYEGPFNYFDGDLLSLADPDGLQIELLAHRDATERGGWPDGPVAEEYRIRGIYSTTIDEKNDEPTARMLVDVMGFHPTSCHRGEIRFESGIGGAGTLINIRTLPNAPVSFVAAGSIHHIAWRVPGIDDQKNWSAFLTSKGIGVTQIVDRRYFNSVYFREPGGVLFELATDMPGFTVDERMEELGSKLMLPPWLERNRAQIEKNLPPIKTKKVQENIERE